MLLMCVHMHYFLVKLIPIVRNLTWIADNRYPSEDGWLGWIRVRGGYGRIDGTVSG